LPPAPRPLPPEGETEPRSDKRALCLSAVELTGADPDEETASSFTDILEVARAGFPYILPLTPLLICWLEDGALMLWNKESMWLGDDEDDFGSKLANWGCCGPNGGDGPPLEKRLSCGLGRSIYKILDRG